MLPIVGVPTPGNSGSPQFDGPAVRPGIGPTSGTLTEKFSWPFSGHGGAGGVTPGSSGVPAAALASRSWTALSSVGILIALADAPAAKASEAAIPSAQAPILALG